jgi:hypothetical protein
MNSSEMFSFLLCNMQENWRLSREAEEKRFLLATVNIFLATVLQITLVLTGFHRQVVLLPCWLALIGVYGVVANLKLYERSQFHIARARKLRAKLDALYPDSELEQLFQYAEQEQKRAYPLLMNVRLNNIWTALHALIALLGVIYSIFCLL